MQVFEALSFSNLAAQASGVPTGNVTVDWTNYVTRNLIGCFLPGVTQTQDLTGGIGGIPYMNPDVGFSLGTNPDGPSSAFVSNVQAGMYAVAPSGSPYRYTTEFSVRARVMMPASASFLEVAGVVFDATINTGPFNLATIVSNSGGTQINLSWNVGGTSTTFLTPAFPTKVMLDWLATFKVGGNVTWYVNGVQAAQTTFGASAPTNSANTGIVVSGGANATQRNGAWVSLAMFWNRELTADEAMAMYLSPYGFLIPQDGDIQLLFVPPPPPGPPLVVSTWSAAEY